MAEHTHSTSMRRGQPAPEDLPKLTYPTWRYHPKKPAVIVHSPTEEDALGDGWSDSPDPKAAENRAKRADAIADGTFVDETPEVKPVPFPSWRYHKDGRSQIVHSADQDRSLGGEWTDAPAPTEPEPVQPREIAGGAFQVAGVIPAPKMPINGPLATINSEGRVANWRGEPVDDASAAIVLGTSHEDGDPAPSEEASGDDDKRGKRGKSKKD